MMFVTLRTTSADSGVYMCVATNRYNTTRVFTSDSPEVKITVKGEFTCHSMYKV